VASAATPAPASAANATLLAPMATPTLVPTTNPTPVLAGTPAVAQGALNLTSMTGESAYLWSCAGCHGADGRGVPFVGSNLLDSQLVQSGDGFAIYDFLVNGKPLADPRVEYPHPPRGGYPQLTDEQIRSIVAYLYTLSH